MRDIILLILMQTKGIGEKTIKKIIHFMNENEQYSWDDLINDKSILISKLNIKPNIVTSINPDTLPIESIINHVNNNGMKMIIETDKEYPIQLKKKLQDDCPSVLFVKGDLTVLNNMSVGFCGSRNVSVKGLSIAQSCAKQLVENNITVVSGYARGTDLAAHKAALLYGGKTVFVLAEGILQYKNKSEVSDLLKSDNHIFVSQFYPTAMWNVGNAMARNRTIIGLSDAMVLVESGKTGGTFAAGEESLKKNCPLFVIDFEQPEVSAEANPYFIARGGHPIRGQKGIPNISGIIKTINYRQIQSNSNMYSEQLSFADIM